MATSNEYTKPFITAGSERTSEAGEGNELNSLLVTDNHPSFIKDSKK